MNATFTPAAIASQDETALAYDPESQSIVAVLRDAKDDAVIVRRTHESHACHALDALAAAFAAEDGPVRHVAGLLHWAGGVPVIEPWAVACDTVVVPDFAAGTGALGKTPLGVVPDEAREPISTALRALQGALAALLHHGTAQLPMAGKMTVPRPCVPWRARACTSWPASSRPWARQRWPHGPTRRTRAWHRCCWTWPRWRNCMRMRR